MQSINDLDHFVLQEGETLILRCTQHPTEEQLAKMREVVERALPGRPVLILPPELEVFAGKLEVYGVDHVVGDEITIPDELIEAARKEITDAYEDGRSVYVDEGDHAWLVMHKHYNPIVRWEWDRCVYSLTKPRKSG